MSMMHHAFAIDWSVFSGDLRPLFEVSLAAGDRQAFMAFIAERHSEITDPYEGDPLQEGWKSSLEIADIQEIADYALTATYSLLDDHGLGSMWIALDASLPEAAKPRLLGTAIGGFDPGRKGSYFQSPEQIAESLVVLKPHAKEIIPFWGLLEQCHANRKGIYVTF